MLQSCIELQIQFGFHSGKTHGVHINQAVCGPTSLRAVFVFCLSKGFQIIGPCGLFWRDPSLAETS